MEDGSSEVPRTDPRSAGSRLARRFRPHLGRGNAAPSVVLALPRDIDEQRGGKSLRAAPILEIERGAEAAEELSIMVGKVLFPYKSSRVEAMLDDDGLWRCEALPCLVRVLNILHSPVWAGEPLDGPSLHRCLQSAAVWLKGEVHFPRRRRRRRRRRGSGALVKCTHGVGHEIATSLSGPTHPLSLVPPGFRLWKPKHFIVIYAQKEKSVFLVRSRPSMMLPVVSRGPDGP